MLKTAILAAIAAMGLAGTAIAEAETHITDYDFSYEGPFGAFDQMQLQRGLQVYTEVCAACHGLKYVSYRNLADEGGPGLPEDQVRAYAAQFETFDEELDDFRPATPADKFPESALPEAPDLSLMAKSRAGFHGPYGSGLNQLFKGMGGPEYVASLLTGYEEAPACAPEDFAGYYNVAFASGGFPESCIDDEGHHEVPGSWIAMPPPLLGDDVTYEDGHEASVVEEAKDVTAFMMWTAEPKMMARKQAGFTGVLFLGLLAVLLYFTNKRIWHRAKYGPRDK
ncbi:MAG: ubiquinol-cytochrome c reductase cytochrome c1 subunit [Limimaricola cinnabarinus]|jgi:ubiquinol-cytochrome c reductase cytochrome c1 subunit|uniref:Cytochrome c1 n=1 Tax=Limimaricola cinnabarinus LL-001 TaxID=1337093 RepID=U2Z0D2_9RHOB|nr:cytochrome c1 [Limimaricola cinnabarinus]GAD54795.1 ubiquinol cytochrome C oxidoreductase, cytochrome C1 subunit [Limimaricola cinnabarinus LL-001]